MYKWQKLLTYGQQMCWLNICIFKSMICFFWNFSNESCNCIILEFQEIWQHQMFSTMLFNGTFILILSQHLLTNIQKYWKEWFRGSQSWILSHFNREMFHNIFFSGTSVLVFKIFIFFWNEKFGKHHFFKKTFFSYVCCFKNFHLFSILLLSKCPLKFVDNVWYTQKCSRTSRNEKKWKTDLGGKTAFFPSRLDFTS